MARHNLIQCDLCGEVIPKPAVVRFSAVLRWSNISPNGTAIPEKDVPVTLGDLCLSCLILLKSGLHFQVVKWVEEHTKAAVGKLPYRVVDQPPTER